MVVTYNRDEICERISRQILAAMDGKELIEFCQVNFGGDNHSYNETDDTVSFDVDLEMVNLTPAKEEAETSETSLAIIIEKLVQVNPFNEKDVVVEYRSVIRGNKDGDCWDMWTSDWGNDQSTALRKASKLISDMPTDFLAKIAMK